MSHNRQKVIDIAVSQLGYHEWFVIKMQSLSPMSTVTEVLGNMRDFLLVLMACFTFWLAGGPDKMEDEYDALPPSDLS